MSRLELLRDNIPQILDTLREKPLWQIVVLALIVFGLTALSGKIRKTGGKVILFVVLLGVTLVCSGILLLENGVRANAYSVSDDVIAVAAYLEEEMPDEQVYVAASLRDEMRMYAAGVLLFSDEELGSEVIRNAAEQAGCEVGEFSVLENWLSGTTGVVQAAGFLNTHPDIAAVVLHGDEKTKRGMQECGWKVDAEIHDYVIYVSDQAGWSMTEYGSASGEQALFYTLVNRRDGTLIVVDGGWTADEDQVRQVIEAQGGTVDAWFLTHYHEDHIGAFNRIMADPQGIEIKTIYVSEPDPETLMASFREWDNPETFAAFQEVTAGSDKLVPLHRGDTLDIDGLQVQVFNAYADDLPVKTKDLSNDLSLVLRFSGKEDSFLLCADARGETVAKEMAETFGEALRSDYLQLGHHGNHGLPNVFYDMVGAETAFFDAPAWLMQSDDYGMKELSGYLAASGLRIFDHSTAPNGFILK